MLSYYKKTLQIHTYITKYHRPFLSLKIIPIMTEPAND